MSDYARVAEAIRFLREKGREQPSLSALADHAELSLWHFQRVFEKWAGISPKRFLQFLTLGAARKLLMDAATIVDASVAAGLSSPSRLHDLFLNLEGMTPGQFKRRAQGLTVLWARLQTPLGPALFAQLNHHLVAVSFLEGSNAAPGVADLRGRWPGARFQEAPGVLEPLGRALEVRLRGGAFRPLVETLRGSPLHSKVWEGLLRVPEGKVLTFQGLADAGAERAAAGSLGAGIRRDTIASLIPCHRLIRASGIVEPYAWGDSRRKTQRSPLEASGSKA